MLLLLPSTVGPSEVLLLYFEALPKDAAMNSHGAEDGTQHGVHSLHLHLTCSTSSAAKWWWQLCCLAYVRLVMTCCMHKAHSCGLQGPYRPDPVSCCHAPPCQEC